jgi:hypothetical protein
MKRILTLLATIAVACSLTLPVYAKQGAKKEAAAPSTTEHAKAHLTHAKKKGAKKGKKEGQEGTNPSAETSKK